MEQEQEQKKEEPTQFICEKCKNIGIRAAKGLCIKCYNKINARRYYQDPVKREKILARNKEWQKQHKGYWITYMKEYYKKNPDRYKKFLEYQKQWREKRKKEKSVKIAKPISP